MRMEKAKLEQIERELGTKCDAFVDQLESRLGAARLKVTVNRQKRITMLRVEDDQVPTFMVLFEVRAEIYTWSARLNRVSCTMRGGANSTRKYTRLDDKQAEKLVLEAMLARDRALQKETAKRADRKLRDEAVQLMRSELAGQVMPPGVCITPRAPGQYRVVFGARVPGALLDTDLNANEVIRLLALLREIQHVDEMLVIVAADGTYYEPDFYSFGSFPKAILPANLEANLHTAQRVAEQLGRAPVRTIAYSEIAAAAAV